MKKILLVLLLSFVPLFTAAQNINGRFSSSVYAFERFQDVNNSEMYIRGFQALNLNINKSNYSIRTRLNFETDFQNPLKNDPRLRVYNLYFEARKVLDIATLKIGRQTLFSSIAGGTFDGANLKLKFKKFSLTGYYGGNVPAYQNFEITNDWQNDYVMGGKLKVTAVQNFTFVLGYIDKNFKSVQYPTTRLDETYNPMKYIIEKNSNQFRYVSGQIKYASDNNFRIDSKLDYDLNYFIPSKFELGGRYEKFENIGLSLYYNYREPRIRYNSIFSVFNYGNTQEVEAGVDFKMDEITFLAKVGMVQYKDDESQRLSVGMYSKYGSVNYRKTFGYAGELDAVSISTAKSLFNGFLTPSIGLTYTTYKLTVDGPKNDLMSAVMGINVRPWRNFSFDLQGQYLNNKYFKNDFRVFLKINHWFNTNLSII